MYNTYYQLAFPFIIGEICHLCSWTLDTIVELIMWLITLEPQENNKQKIHLSTTTLTLSFSFVSSNLSLRFTTWRLIAVRCCFIIKSSVFLTDIFMALKALFVMLRLYHDIQYNSLVLSSLSLTVLCDFIFAGHQVAVGR